MIKKITTFFKLYLLLLIVFLGSCQPSIQVSPWDVIDGNSVLVFESNNVPILPDKNYEQYFKARTNLYLSAVQRSSQEKFDIIYSYVLRESSYDSLTNLKLLPGNQKLVNRKFNGVDIHEVKNHQNEFQLAFAFIDGVFVLSKSSVLVENAIRVFQSREKKDFKISHPALFQFPSLKSDQGNIYLNSDPVSRMLFSYSPKLASIPLLKDLRNEAVYDIALKNGYLSMNGFSTGSNSSLGLFQKQKPVSFRVAKYIPNTSKALVHFGITDSRPFGMDSSALRSIGMGSEIVFISPGNSTNELTAILEIKSGADENFDFITEYAESYSNYQIRSINGKLLKKRFERVFPDIEFAFCTVVDSYLLLTQSVDEIKSAIDAIENDDTWGKTQDYQKFSEKELQESNVTLIVKSPDFFSSDDGILREYPLLIDSLGLSAISWYSVQMSALDKHFYSNINISLGSSTAGSKQLNPQASASSITLPGVIKYGSLVKNHNNGSKEIIAQDADNWIYLISPEEGIIWKRQLDSPIQSPLEQLDYYRNGKLQYFFSTGDKIYLVDRLGRDVTGFPKSLASSIKYSSVVDYDKTKNYRYLTALTDNRVYLLDKEGKNLAEWGPKKFDNHIAFPPKHFKVGGTDHFIVVLADGTVVIYNRKGNQTNKFKTVNNTFFNGDIYVESGLSANETYLYYMTKDGALVKQNLNGEVRSTDNLLRGNGSTFILKQINNNNGFYICRVDTDKLALFDNHGKMLYEKQNTGSTLIDFQIFSSGNNKMIFAFLDTEQKICQLLDESGNPVFHVPIDSNITPLLDFGKSANGMNVYSFAENSIVISTLK